MGGRRFRRVTAVVLAVVVGCGVTPWTSPALGAARASEPMTVERLLTQRIPKACAFRAAVYVDGAHPDSPGPDFSFAEVVGAGNIDFPLQAHVGDFTGNGVADGVMDVICTYGGNNIVFNVFAYRSDGRSLGRVPVERYVPTTFWSPQYPEVSIRNGKIRIAVDTWAPGDSHCCPSISRFLRFRWDGLRFVKL